MNPAVPNLAPAMKELTVSNELLGNPDALKAAWDRDGYWFFRGVLDRTVIARIRGIYMSLLADLGVADRDDPEGRYNGGDLSVMPPRMEPLIKAKVCRELHEAPEINAFFTRLFGCDPFWVPFTEYRATPPATDRNRPRFDFIHEDGVYNDGLPFLICWVPLAEIDDAVGGLAVVEGVQNGPCLHRKEGMKIEAIRPEDVPEGTWRRTTYQPGDVVLMGLHTPHSGVSNLSNRFRLSMDTRVMPSSGKVPIVGTLTAVGTDQLGVRDAAGERTLRLDDKTFIRGLNGDQMPRLDIPGRFSPGDAVIIACEGDRVVNMRPQH